MDSQDLNARRELGTMVIKNTVSNGEPFFVSITR